MVPVTLPTTILVPPFLAASEPTNVRSVFDGFDGSNGYGRLMDSADAKIDEFAWITFLMLESRNRWIQYFASTVMVF
jgi:hypothetical protein